MRRRRAPASEPQSPTRTPPTSAAGPGPAPRRVLRRLAVFSGAAALLLYLALLGWAARLELLAAAFAPGNIAAVEVLARDGSLLRQALPREEGGASWVPLARISPHLIQATLAAEDKRFFSHQGIDPWAVLRALWCNVRQQRIVSGASTLTMQLVRLLQPEPRSLPSKLRESVLAVKLERALAKEQILWLYLNRAPYGHGAFGVEAAARRYLGKPAAQLSLAEAALLAALPKGPSSYSPFRHRQRLERRQRQILARMAAQGRISAEQLALARAEPLRLRPAARPFAAPHFVARVLALPQARGAGWLQTTLDLPLQRRAEAVVARVVRQLEAQGVQNAAALVVDNATGEVRAYVGSADFFDAERQGQVDGTLALRQPGSTIKPFTYALALEQGASLATVLQDLPARFATKDGDYTPRNYDGAFHGPVRLRVALGSSYNLPAIRAAERVGIRQLLERLRQAGFRSLERPAEHYGLGLTLGNGEVSLQELVAAYATLARGGRTLPLRLLKEARTPTGQLLPLAPSSARRVFEQRVAYLISEALADPLARLPAFGPDSALELGFSAAVKTGTSKGFRDNWTVGYTPRYTVGVWVGNFDGSAMHNVSGISGAGPLWAELMRAVSDGAGEPFAQPPGLVRRAICPVSGQPVGPHCPGAVEELFLAEQQPEPPCELHQLIAIDRRNGLRAGPGCPPSQTEEQAFLVLPAAYRRWAHAQGLPAPPERYSPRCPGAPAEQPARVRVRSPSAGERYFLDPDLQRRFQRLPLEAVVEGGASAVRWRVDGRLVARSPAPYSASWPLERGRHEIVAELPDGQRSQPVVISVH